MDGAYREFNTSGRARTVQRSTTASSEPSAPPNKRRSEQERVLDERKDQALLNTYGSEKDIEIMRSRAERDLTAAIQAAQDRIAEIPQAAQEIRG